MTRVELRVEIDEHLVEQAKAAGISLTSAVERTLRAELGPAAAEERARRWATESADFIEAHNRFVERYGAFGSEWRAW